MSRPIEFNDDVVRKLEEVFALDGTVEEACLYANISRDTYYRHIKEKPELSDRFEELRQRPVLLARQTVVKSLKDPNHAFRYLERKRKKEFGANMEVDLNVIKKVISVDE
jgi:hypothetical protein